MADPISREEAINVLCSTERKQVDADSRVWVDRAEVVRRLSKLPSADVKPVVHGKWNYINGGVWGCSECRYFMGWKPRFCPNCGADMRGNNND